MWDNFLRPELPFSVTLEGPLQYWSHIRPTAKRVFDVVGALSLLLVLFPLIVILVVVISLQGQFPFYAHRRIGKRGREFNCIKFRTMQRNADLLLQRFLESNPAASVEWNTNQKLKNDPRVTIVGRILRASSLDELPQLLNVLAGHMSLVGPRPVTHSEIAKFYGSAEVKAYQSIRPGLTGLWQVSGRSEIGFDRRLLLDTFYAENLSLRSDLVILWRTVAVVVLQRGAW